MDITGLVVFSWNLYNGGANEAREMALSEEMNRARLEQEAAARTVRETIDKTFAAYIIGQQRVSAAQRQVSANDQLVKQYREEYKLAKRSLLDLLDSESALFNGQFQLTSVKAVRLLLGLSFAGGNRAPVSKSWCASPAGSRCPSARSGKYQHLQD